jgi:hypothetical protein
MQKDVSARRPSITAGALSVMVPPPRTQAQRAPWTIVEA